MFSASPPKFILGALFALVNLCLLTSSDAAQDKSGIEPFTIAVDDPVLRDLKVRLARTRFPEEIDKSSGITASTSLT